MTNGYLEKQRAMLIEQGIDDEGNINKVRVKVHGAEAAANS